MALRQAFWLCKFTVCKMDAGPPAGSSPVQTPAAGLAAPSQEAAAQNSPDHAAFSPAPALLDFLRLHSRFGHGPDTSGMPSASGAGATAAGCGDETGPADNGPSPTADAAPAAAREAPQAGVQPSLHQEILSAAAQPVADARNAAAAIAAAGASSARAAADISALVAR